MDMRPDPANPYRMRPADRKRMAASLSEFGDLGGIVLNRRTGLLIGGHQRTDAMPGATIDTADLPAMEPDGTVARGWLVYQGRRFALRVVDWTPAKAHAAMLAANLFARVGEDDATALEALLAELTAAETDMDLTGFDSDALAKAMAETAQDEKAAPGEFPEVDENVETEHECPKCGYKWSGGQ